MNYIVHRRFKDTALCGPVNIPATTEVECKNGLLFHNGAVLCCENCENAHQFFARNDDGNGMERGQLTQAIMKTLAKRKSRDDPEYQERWDKIWGDPLCQQYKRTDYTDYWLWNHAFFNAPICNLQHIADLVGAKV